MKRGEDHPVLGPDYGLPYRRGSYMIVRKRRLADPKRQATREHRAIWEHFNGPIPKGHDVHHRNEDKLDNRIENLELMTKENHRLLHGNLFQPGHPYLGPRGERWHEARRKVEAS